VRARPDCWPSEATRAHANESGVHEPAVSFAEANVIIVSKADKGNMRQWTTPARHLVEKLRGNRAVGFCLVAAAREKRSTMPLGVRVFATWCSRR
jgi:hypothetical protein